MEYYEILACATFVIAALAAILWMRTRNLSIPLGIAILYYWSLYGAWAVITDRLGGSSGRLYEYLEAKMFAVALDDSYFETLVLYGLFIIVIELTLLLLVQPESLLNRTLLPVRISHVRILLFATSAGTASWLIVRPYLNQALQLGLSGYHATRDTSPYFSIHQVLNRAALIALAIGIATLCSGPAPRLLVGERRFWTIGAYVVVLGAIYSFNFALGNKNEPLNASVVGCLVYLHNTRRRRWISVAAASVLLMCGLWLIDNFRAYALSEVVARLEAFDFSSLLGNSYTLVNTSNEPFAAHFSMYGVLAYHIEPVWGQSIVSLVASVVPHLLWQNRPPDVYAYYTASVGAVSGQGYTIHHATGWYLNFGVLGVPVGAIVLGCLWSGCLNAYAHRGCSASRWGLVFRALAPWLFAAFLPNLVRAGIEGYKSAILEGLLIPVTIVALADPRFGWRSVHRTRVRNRVPRPALQLATCPSLQGYSHEAPLRGHKERE